MQIFKYNLSKSFSHSFLKKELLIELSSYLIILLFLYAAISKLTIFVEFQQQMMKSPLIPRSLIPFLAVAVPGGEIIIAWLLVFERTKQIGFYLAFFTMLMFTLYLIILVSVAENAPCSCGGILSSLSYPQHIVLNLIFTLIALYGSIIFSNKEK